MPKLEPKMKMILPIFLTLWLEVTSGAVLQSNNLTVNEPHHIVKRSPLSRFSADKKYACPEIGPTICFASDYDYECHSHKDCPGNQMCCLFYCLHSCTRPIRVTEFDFKNGDNSLRVIKQIKFNQDMSENPTKNDDDNQTKAQNTDYGPAERLDASNGITDRVSQIALEDETKEIRRSPFSTFFKLFGSVSFQYESLANVNSSDSDNKTKKWDDNFADNETSSSQNPKINLATHLNMSNISDFYKAAPLDMHNETAKATDKEIKTTYPTPNPYSSFELLKHLYENTNITENEVKPIRPIPSFYYIEFIKHLHTCNGSFKARENEINANHITQSPNSNTKLVMYLKLFNETSKATENEVKPIHSIPTPYSYTDLIKHLHMHNESIKTTENEINASHITQSPNYNTKLVMFLKLYNETSKATENEVKPTHSIPPPYSYTELMNYLHMYNESIKSRENEINASHITPSPNSNTKFVPALNNSTPNSGELDKVKELLP